MKTPKKMTSKSFWSMLGCSLVMVGDKNKKKKKKKKVSMKIKGPLASTKEHQY